MVTSVGFLLCCCFVLDGQILPGVKVVIANPETKGMCADSHLGEVSHSEFTDDNSHFHSLVEH